MAVLQEHPLTGLNTVLNSLFGKLTLSLTQRADYKSVGHTHLAG